MENRNRVFAERKWFCFVCPTDLEFEESRKGEQSLGLSWMVMNEEAPEERPFILARMVLREEEGVVFLTDGKEQTHTINNNNELRGKVRDFLKLVEAQLG